MERLELRQWSVSQWLSIGQRRRCIADRHNDGWITHVVVGDGFEDATDQLLAHASLGFIIGQPGGTDLHSDFNSIGISTAKSDMMLVLDDGQEMRSAFDWISNPGQTFSGGITNDDAETTGWMTFRNDGVNIRNNTDTSGDRIEQIVYDADASRAWAPQERMFDNGAMVLNDVMFDNGDTHVQLFNNGALFAESRTDVADKRGWASMLANYDLAGNLETDEFTFDDGRRMEREYDSGGDVTSRVRFDVADILNWVQIEEMYTDGLVTQRNVRQDDGDTVALRYTYAGVLESGVFVDTADNFAWDNRTLTYDASGDVIDVADELVIV